jgi:hypothetical protein
MAGSRANANIGVVTPRRFPRALVGRGHRRVFRREGRGRPKARPVLFFPLVSLPSDVILKSPNFFYRRLWLLEIGSTLCCCYRYRFYFLAFVPQMSPQNKFIVLGFNLHLDSCHFVPNIRLISDPKR